MTTCSGLISQGDYKGALEILHYLIGELLYRKQS